MIYQSYNICVKYLSIKETLDDVDKSRGIRVGRHNKASRLNHPAFDGNTSASYLLVALVKVLGVTGF